MGEINELRRVREEKVQKLKEYGVSVHPERFETTHSLNEAMKLDEGEQNVRVAGRVMSRERWVKYLLWI